MNDSIVAPIEVCTVNSYRHFEVESSGDITVIHLTRLELMDRLVTNELQDDLVTFVEEERPQKLVINFERLRRCSTEIINSMLRARKRVGSYQGRMRLCSMQDPIHEVFRLLNLEGTVFEIFDSVEQAADGF